MNLWNSSWFFRTTSITVWFVPFHFLRWSERFYIFYFKGSFVWFGLVEWKSNIMLRVIIWKSSHISFIDRLRKFSSLFLVNQYFFKIPHLVQILPAKCFYSVENMFLIDILMLTQKCFLLVCFEKTSCSL